MCLAGISQKLLERIQTLDLWKDEEGNEELDEDAFDDESNAEEEEEETPPEPEALEDKTNKTPNNAETGQAPPEKTSCEPAPVNESTSQASPSNQAGAPPVAAAPPGKVALNTKLDK